jgi:uncharacterized protein YggU (UPF0235/DUF167 family)
VRGIDVRAHDDGVVIAVQVRPRSRPGIELTDAGLVIRVAAPPEKGKATEEARRALAEALDVPSKAASLRTGPASRRKTFFVEGVDPESARERLLSATR